MSDLMRIGGLDLSPNQQKAIVLLARGGKIKDVAKEVGVTEQTIYNWKTDTQFMEDLKDETRSYLEESRLRLASLTLPAIETLAMLLNSKNPAIQLKAVQEILKSHGLDSLDGHKHSMLGLGLETAYSRECEQEQAQEQRLFSIMGI